MEMHKQRRNYFLAGEMGQQKCTSKRGSTSQQEEWGSENFFFWQLHGEAGTWWYQGVVRTSGADLGLEHSVVVLRTMRWWPLLTPFSSREERPNSEIRTIVLT